MDIKSMERRRRIQNNLELQTSNRRALRAFTLVELLACQPKPWRRQAHRAFTLIELLAVIAIIMMLASLLWPATRQMLGRARAAECANNLHQMGIAIQVYAQDNNQKLPAIEPLPSQPVIPSAPLPSLHDTLLKYMGGNEKVFRCARDNARWPLEGASYEWCYPYNDDLVDVPKAWIFNVQPVKATLLWDYDNVHGDQGGPHTKNILYADGHVKGI